MGSTESGVRLLGNPAQHLLIEAAQRVKINPQHIERQNQTGRLAHCTDDGRDTANRTVGKTMDDGVSIVHIGYVGNNFQAGYDFLQLLFHELILVEREGRTIVADICSDMNALAGDGRVKDQIEFQIVICNYVRRVVALITHGFPSVNTTARFDRPQIRVNHVLQLQTFQLIVRVKVGSNCRFANCSLQAVNQSTYVDVAETGQMGLQSFRTHNDETTARNFANDVDLRLVKSVTIPDVIFRIEVQHLDLTARQTGGRPVIGTYSVSISILRSDKTRRRNPNITARNIIFNFRPRAVHSPV